MATISLKYVKVKEKLFIARHRLGINQTRMAKYYGLTRHEISDMELGELKVSSKIKDISEIELTKTEVCIILRRRANLNHTQLSGKMGVSRSWVSLMETGRRNPARLFEYWSS